MALIERIIGEQEPKIPLHQFVAVLGEVDRGQVTQAQVATRFNFNAAEQTELASIVSLVASKGNATARALFRIEFENVCVLAERGLGYNTAAETRTRLGL